MVTVWELVESKKKEKRKEKGRRSVMSKSEGTNRWH